MRFKTVKGLIVKDHVIVDNKTLWLTKDSKLSCKGYFLLKCLGFKYELLKVLREKEK